jgi:hypothetical protein
MVLVVDEQRRAHFVGEGDEIDAADPQVPVGARVSGDGEEPPTNRSLVRMEPASERTLGLAWHETEGYRAKPAPPGDGRVGDYSVATLAL